jgi:hypothetical protein
MVAPRQRVAHLHGLGVNQGAILMDMSLMAFHSVIWSVPRCEELMRLDHCITLPEMLGRVDSDECFYVLWSPADCRVFILVG